MSALQSVFGRIRSIVDLIPTFFDEPDATRYMAVGESAGGFTIPDPAAALPISDRHIRDIHAPGLKNGSLPVILFRTAHTGSPTFLVRLNATRLTQHMFSASDTGARSWHEIVAAGALKPEDNELTFAVNGDGSVTFSDVVIVYTSNKLTIQRPVPEPVLSPD